MENKITILLATYNGEKYLGQQLDSLFSQTYKNFEIIARDDKSSDKTLEILQSYNIKIVDSKENIGAKRSFGALLEYATNNNASKYFMFCDQDDIWEKNKIEQTLVKMQEIEKIFPNQPVLVHTDLKVVDETLKLLNQSFMSYQGINAEDNNLNNLILQNTMTGCTMMINSKLAKICLPIPIESIMHDWWIGLIASKFGKITYLDNATIKYRQHANNSLGAKKFNIVYAVHNIYKKNLLADNITQAKEFLKTFRNKLDKNDIEMLEDFTTIESKTFWQKRQILVKYKLFKQGLIRNIGLLLKI